MAGCWATPIERVRISVVDLDRGPCGLPEKDLNGLPRKTWSQVVIRDLEKTGGIRVEVLPSREEADRLIRYHRRAAVLVFRPEFSERAESCSFVEWVDAAHQVKGLNPFHRDGVYLDKVGVELLSDIKQPAGSAVSSQVAQVSLLRVLLPWMIGRAFEKLSEDKFIELLGTKVRLPVPAQFKFLLGQMGLKPDPKTGHVQLNDLVRVAAAGNEDKMREYRTKIGQGVQEALSEQFKNYDLTGKTWASLTKSKEAGASEETAPTGEGLGPIKRGAAVYQFLVPSYTVLFAFFLVLNVGRVFVDERSQGTLKRLRAAPIGRGTLLLGKLVPYFLLSLGQGAVLLIAGRLVFGMRWGPQEWPLWRQVATLVPVVFTTSLAAMGLALLVAAVAKTEAQVVLYGAVPVLVLALLGGCVLPREWMPEQAKNVALLTPQGWALTPIVSCSTSTRRRSRIWRSCLRHAVC